MAEKNIIRYISKNDFNQIIEISNDKFGKNFITQKSLNSLFKDSFSFCLVSENSKTNEVVGFIILKIIDYDEFVSIIKNYKNFNLNNVRQIGYVKTVAIKSGYEKNGIATQLVSAGIQNLSRMGCRVFLSTVWKHDHDSYMKSILKKSGFCECFEIPKYWHDFSIINNCKCPICGNVCNCSCIIFFKY